MAKLGKEYEQAVHRFVERLMPGANVIPDHKVPDRDTGSLRQVDVWIEGKIAGHYPITINISCKDHGRKVDVTKMGTFIDEVRSTEASTGIIYSRKGFSKNALKKAEANQVACCTLYQNAPADMPAVVWFWYYACIPKIELRTPSADQDARTIEWKDFLHRPTGKDGQTVGEHIDETFRAGQSIALKDAESKNHLGFPVSRQHEYEYAGFGDSMTAKFTVVLHYFYYRARMEGHLLNGSYCANTGEFSGAISGPILDTRGPSPGPDWEEISCPPDIDGNSVVMTLKHDGISEGIEEQFQNLPLTHSQLSLSAPGE